MSDHVHSFLSKWTTAERSGDAETLATLLTDDFSVVTARNSTRGTCQGQPLPEALRVTLVITPDSEAVRVAAVHMSFIAGTQGAPPMPGPSDSAESSAATNADREGQ
jgi:hypothetical protein